MSGSVELGAPLLRSGTISSIDSEHIEAVYGRYFGIIWHKCARMLGDSDDAKDVAQETFTRLWAKRETVRDERAVVAWIYRTSTRLAFARYRAGIRHVSYIEHEAEGPVERGSTPESLVLLRDVFVKVLAIAPRREFECAVLNRVDGLTQSEIADVLKVSDRTVRRLLTQFQQRVDLVPSSERTAS